MRRLRPLDLATPYEFTQLRGVLGGLQWRAVQTAPQLSATVSLLKSREPGATIQVLEDAKAAVRAAKREAAVSIRVWVSSKLPWWEHHFVTWVDAANGNRLDGKSTGGVFVGCAPPALSKGDWAKVSPIAWGSYKLPRVALG